MTARLTSPRTPYETTMEAHSYVFDTHRPSRKQSLKITAKRYTTMASSKNIHGLTLLFTHCIGSHKEQWEPVIERVFMLQERKDETHRIREAWSFDWQSHGDAATLNREILTSRENGVSVYEWSPAIAHFVRSAHMKGHRIVPVGHSAGAATMIMTTKEIPTNELSYVAMILVEPTLVTRELFNAHLEDRMASMDFAIAATSARRDRWPSKEHAFEYFKKRIPWGFWDPRVVRLLTEYGLEETSSGNVTLKCHKKQEANSYPDVEPHFEGAIQLGRICHSLPVHLIWGTRNDLVPEFIQDSLSDVSQGRMVASVTKVKRAGHMVVQEQPDLLAQAISDVLNTIDPGCCIGRSKL